MKVSFFIVGLGQIGSSLSLALKRRKIAHLILGKDIKRRSFYKGIIDEYVEEIEEGVERADIIILSTPAIEIINLIRKIAPFLREDKILLDTGSTKKEILKEMQKHPDKILIGGHPMAGNVRKGKDAIDENLFEGKPFFLCFPNENSKNGGRIIKDIVRGIGAIPYEIDPESHDQFTSVVSHLPYVLSVALYSIFQDFQRKEKRIKDFVSTGFIGSARLALTDLKMAEGIILTNKSNIIEKIEIFIRKLQELKNKIEKNEISKFISTVKKDIEKRRKIYENFRF